MTTDKKCVIIVNENLPLGLIANTAAVLGNTLGSHIPELVGKDVLDKNSVPHLGVIEIPIPILKGNVEILSNMMAKLLQPEYSDLLIADFSETGQSCKNYDEYIEKMSKVETNELKYCGIAIYGDKKKVNKLTGNIGLLR